MATGVPSTIPLDELFQRSQGLHERALSVFDQMGSPTAARQRLAIHFAAVSMEHWGAQRLLLANGLDASAFVLVRVQVEVTIRAVWILECADESWLGQFIAHQPVERLAEPVMGPPVGAMLKAIDERAPQIARMLQELKDASWEAMHSFVHGGARPIVQQIAGTTDYQVSAVLRNANGLGLLATNVVTRALQDHRLTGHVARLQREFSNCLPPLAQ